MNRARFRILWLAINSFAAGVALMSTAMQVGLGNAPFAALSGGLFVLNAAIACHHARFLAPSIRGVSITLGRGQ